MKPVSLRMTAFGPYPTTEVVDFAALGTENLFLICGETGAGKTAMLDAICFALFGQASGTDRTSKSLRSDHAKPSLLTEIELEFMLNQRRYRVVRSPEQMRPKQRGDGLTKESGSATFWEEKGGGWRIITTGSGPVSDEIECRLGFGASQFRQLVVLPQGDFRSLLTAKSSDREAILAKLFDTKRYGTLQETLEKRARGLKRQLEDGDKKRKALLQQAQMDDVAALVKEISNLESQVAAHQQAGTLLRKKVEVCRDNLEEARRIAALFKESSEAKQALSSLLTEKEQIDTARRILITAERADTVSDAEKFLEDRRRACKTANAHAEAARAECNTAQQAADHAKKKFETEAAREAERNAARTECERLTALMDSTEQRTQIFHEAQLAEQRLVAKKRQLNTLGDQINAQTVQIETLKGTLEAAQTAEKMAQQLQATLVRIEQARADLGSLARSLKDGEPCPVCGSPDHPNPARDHIPAEDQQMAEYRTQLKAAQQTASQQASTEERLQIATHNAKTTSDAHSVASDEYETLRSQQAETAARQKIVLDELPEQLRTPGALESAHTQAKAVMDNMNAALNDAQTSMHTAQNVLKTKEGLREERNRAVAVAEERMRDQVDELSTRILEAGFADQGDFESAKRSRSERETLRNTIHTWDKSCASATDRKARSEAGTAGLTPRDVPAIEKQYTEAATAYQEHDMSTAATRERFHELLRTQSSIETIDTEQGDHKKEFSVVGRLAEVSNGKNPFRITFERFVQAELLDRVLSCANQRFYPMSEGRYRLQRATSLKDKRRGAGLDLEVFDANTGFARPASTLSGGEGFEACLSLALGMADTVQSQSGGIHLESIFVDEGFGSLGGEDLDRVIEALKSLQKGGRLVGVISHVRELRERIDARLEVHKSRDGSRTKIVVP